MYTSIEGEILTDQETDILRMVNTYQDCSVIEYHIAGYFKFAIKDISMVLTGLSNKGFLHTFPHIDLGNQSPAYFVTDKAKRNLLYWGNSEAVKKANSKDKIRLIAVKFLYGIICAIIGSVFTIIAKRNGWL